MKNYRISKTICLVVYRMLLTILKQSLGQKDKYLHVVTAKLLLANFMSYDLCKAKIKIPRNMSRHVNVLATLLFMPLFTSTL